MNMKHKHLNTDNDKLNKLIQENINKAIKENEDTIHNLIMNPNPSLRGMYH